MEHALILARAGMIGVEHLPPPAAAPPGTVVCHWQAQSASAGARAEDGIGPTADAIGQLIRRWAEARLHDDAAVEDLYAQLLRLVEPPLLEAVLAKHHGQRAAAARTLGLHRMTLRKKLTELGLDKL